jgi:hypothetical protein
MLKTGIAFLAGFVVLAILIEARNRKPRATGGGLPRLGVESVGKGIILGKLGAQALQVVLTRSACIHPEPQSLVPDELDDADCLTGGGVLRWCPVQFVLINEHGSRASLLFFFARRTSVLFPCSTCGNTP